MNTFNEFELNRIRKLYQDELAHKQLERSKSTRWTPDVLNNNDNQQQQQRRRHHSSERCSAETPHYMAEQRNKQAAELVDEPPRPVSPYVDPKRYEHALANKSRSARRARPGPSSSRQTPRFGRALFDFVAVAGEELSMRHGDLVELLEPTGHEWVRVEDCQSGLQGYVPFHYLDLSVGCALARRDVVAGRNELPAAALYASTSTTSSSPTQTAAKIVERLLPMSKGEPITLLRRLSGQLYVASNTRHKLGLVWSKDLDIIIDYNNNNK